MKKKSVEENNISNKSNPSQISTDISSVNKINTYNLKSNIRINRFYTVHHKTDKKENNINKIENNIEKKENKENKENKDNFSSIRCFSHSNKNNSINLIFGTPDSNKKSINNTNNLNNINSYNNRLNMNFPFYEKDTFTNSDKFNGRNTIDSFDSNNIRNNFFDTYNNRAFSANHHYQDSLSNLNLSGLSDNNSLAFNNLYGKFNNLNYQYKTNLENLNFYKNGFTSNTYNKLNNSNNINLYCYRKSLISYINHNTYLNPNYYNCYNNKYIRKGESSSKISELRLTEKNKLFGKNNYEINDLFCNGVNEFKEGETYINKIPNFNNINVFNGK
jgi:hypothetical protein